VYRGTQGREVILAIIVDISPRLLFKLDSKEGALERVLGLSIAERMDSLKVDK
jgi:hypothetical protein